jgi:hypothetical protein
MTTSCLAEGKGRSARSQTAPPKQELAATVY